MAWRSFEIAVTGESDRDTEELELEIERRLSGVLLRCNVSVESEESY